MKYIALDTESQSLLTKWDASVPTWAYSLAERIDDEVHSNTYQWNDVNIAYLKQLNDNEDVVFIFHNAAYDVPTLRLKGINIKPGKYVDTMLMAYVLQPMSGKQNYSLGRLGEFIGYSKMDYRAALIEAGLLRAEREKGAEFLVPFNPVMELYAAQDALVTLHLYEYLITYLQDDPSVFYAYFNIELPYLEVIIEMENGSFIDRSFLTDLEAPTAARVQELEEKILSIYPMAPSVSWDEEKKKYVAKSEKFSAVVSDPASFTVTYKRVVTARGKIAKPKDRVSDPLLYSRDYAYTFEHCKLVPFSPSSDQLAWYFMEHGWKPTEWTKSKRPAIGGEQLKGIDSPLTTPVIEYLDKSKLLSTYISGYLKLLSDDGGGESLRESSHYLRGSFPQTNTVTTRLSSEHPNLQNVDPRVRGAFKAPPGYVMAVADLDSIEVAVLAFFLETLFGDKTMADTIRSGESPHTANALKWGISRPEAKTTLFGLVYGQTSSGLSKKLKVTVARAEEILGQVFAAMPALLDFKEYVVRLAKSRRKFHWYDLNDGEAVTQGWLHLLLGHRVYYPEILSGVPWMRESAQRKLGNVIIQGSAGEIFKYLHTQVFRYAHTIGGRTSMAVHDECMFYIPLREATEENRLKMTELMCSNELLRDGDVSVPVTAEFMFGFDWLEAKSGNFCNLENKERWLELNSLDNRVMKIESVKAVA